MLNFSLSIGLTCPWMTSCDRLLLHSCHSTSQTIHLTMLQETRGHAELTDMKSVDTFVIFQCSHFSTPSMGPTSLHLHVSLERSIMYKTHAPLPVLPSLHTSAHIIGRISLSFYNIPICHKSCAWNIYHDIFM